MADKRLVFVLDNKALIVKSNNEELGRVDVSGVVHDQEVTEVQKLEKSLGEMVKQLNLGKKSAILVLDQTVVYNKTILATDTSSENFEKEKFLSDIPFDPHNLSVRIKSTPTEIKLWAVNKHLFYPFVKILQGVKINIEVVTPDINNSEVNFLKESQKPKKFWWF